MAVSKFNPKSEFKVLSVTDGAIDKENSDLEKFQEDHDMKHIKLKDGEVPTYFILKNVVSSEQADIQEEHFKVELPDLDPEKMATMSKEELSKIRPKIKREKQTQMMIKWFNKACGEYEEAGKRYPCNSDMFGLTVVQEIGSVAMMRASLGE